jgi:hypothetical protein
MGPVTLVDWPSTKVGDRRRAPVALRRSPFLGVSSLNFGPLARVAFFFAAASSPSSASSLPLGVESGGFKVGRLRLMHASLALGEVTGVACLHHLRIDARIPPLGSFPLEVETSHLRAAVPNSGLFCCLIMASVSSIRVC